MTPDTVHRLAQEIRHERSLLTTRELWLQKQEKTAMRDEEFRIINFRKKVIRYAEQELGRQ